jgi:WD40 repeat protein
LIGIILPFPDASQSKKGTYKQEVKPLIVIEDANAPSLSYDGHRIAVGPEVGVTEVYDVIAQKKINTFNVSNSNSHVISTDGKKILIFGSEITGYIGNNYTSREIYSIFEVDSGKLIRQDESKVIRNGTWFSSLVVYSRGRFLSKNITADLSLIAITPPSPKSYENPDPKHPAVILGNLEEYRLVREFTTDGFASGDFWNREAMTPDGRLIVGTRYNVKQSKRDQTVIWDAQTGKVIFSLPFTSYWFSLSDNGQRLVTKRERNSDKELITELWDVSTGKKLFQLKATFKNKKIRVNGGALSPDGKLLATTGTSYVMLWNAENGKLITAVQQVSYGDEDNVVDSVCFSGDGNTLAVSNSSEIVTVWSVKELLGSKYVVPQNN